jgi:hypothetical protein
VSTNPQQPSQDCALAQPQPRRAYKPRRTIKSQAIQNAVIAKHIGGTSKLQISKDLQLAPNTVTSILDLSNVDEVMADGRLATLKRVPAALKTLDIRLEKNSENAAIWLLDKCFDAKNASRKPEPGLTLAIQNLMGNVTVQSKETTPVKQETAIDVSPTISETKGQTQE